MVEANRLGEGIWKIPNLDALVEKATTPKHHKDLSHKEIGNLSFIDEIKWLLKELQEVKEGQQQTIGKEEDYEMVSPLSLEIMSLRLPRGFKMAHVSPYSGQIDPNYMLNNIGR